MSLIDEIPFFQVENFIRKAITEGISANETLGILQDFGLGYRRQDFLADYRRLAEVPIKASRLASVNNRFAPTKELFTETKFDIPTNFRYSVKFSVTIDKTGEQADFYRWVQSDEQMTIGDIKEQGQKAIEMSMQQTNFTVNSAVVNEAQVRNGFEWQA